MALSFGEVVFIDEFDYGESLRIIPRLWVISRLLDEFQEITTIGNDRVEEGLEWLRFAELLRFGVYEANHLIGYFGITKMFGTLPIFVGLAGERRVELSWVMVGYTV